MQNKSPAGLTEEEFSEEQLEWGRWLFAQECKFLQGAPTLADIPEFVLPEVAFAGRSNVGKSSIVNSLTGRTTLARTSNTPGRTQHLNFFDLALRLILVDMPGYGYAEAPKKLVSQWTKLVKQYLQGRPTLRRVFLLIDSRHGLKANDLEVMDLLDKTAVSYQIVLTKADKLKEAELLKLINDITKSLTKHPAAYPKVIATSSVKQAGIVELRAAVAQFGLGAVSQ